MPLVIITADRSRKEVTDELLHELGSKLRLDVAKALSCEDDGGHLTYNDVEVKILDKIPHRHVGGEALNVEVIVIANDYPSRRAYLDKRSQRIGDSVKAVLSPAKLHGYVWVLLAPGAFVEF